ncbi:protein of unknown function [Arachidicoccus rhizosphaerae]|uniref:DUF5074 domain-containing protein n=1 Tax=Arachidicoccus rhizosphaerae TaxID=551991 RepID=A0A1H3W767_9BACT|nr:DUF5074 domain-containing protein [Arachidicoccus rhizosphaerae]SDZ82945.1 protein of unknown function [Arachidicoccus rhizosphaerae]
MKQLFTLKTKSPNRFKLSPVLWACLMVIVLMTACSKNDDNSVTTPTGPYANGFFILNEGWYGHENGSVNFYQYGADTLQLSAFAAANNGNSPTTSTATLEDGAIIGNDLFLISTAGGPITVADAATLQQVGQITMDGSSFRAIAAIDANTAVVSSGSDIYTIDLNSLTINTTPVYAGNYIKKLLKVGDYLLASSNNGVDIIKISDWSLVKHFDGPTEGYVTTKDGTVYGAGGKLLVSVNAASQDTTQIALNQAIWVDDYAYHAPSLVASSKENAIFYIAKPTSGYSGNEIYKYTKGDAGSLNAPFITLPTGETFYSTGLGYDKQNNQIVTWSITGYSETDSNFLRFYDATTGDLVKSIEYKHIYFPGNIVFYN